MPNQNSGWETIAKPRMKTREEYPGGPAAGPGILKTYQDIFNQSVSHTTFPKILVLGATPELRDIVLNKNISLTAIDINADLLDGMGKIMINRSHSEEKTFVGDWLDMPFPENSFDFVMGDGISNNITATSHNQLFSEIKRVLRPAGKVLLRDLMLLNSHPRQPIQELIKQAHQENWHKFDLFMEIYTYSNDGGYNPKEQLVDMSLVEKKLISEIYPQNILTQEEEVCLRQFISGSVKSTFVEEKRWLNNFRQYFDPVNIHKATDYNFCDYFKFFLGNKPS